ncbi:MAG TPA: glycosyltransferase family 4 protein [Acidimicrobiales bacterium]|jgi:glycosyltransferase involved in cell wall biosynthesis|nr:glycosyltransferase family 4 protein [Acidimicrobiales bacterium]
MERVSDDETMTPPGPADWDDLVSSDATTQSGAEPAGLPAFDAPELQPFASLTLEEIAEYAGLASIDVVAWRDFDDPEAGGSELHAHRILSAWSHAGIKVNMTTSSVPDAHRFMRRDGYTVTRRLGRYSIFPRTMISGVLGHLGRGDGLVEIWNGMPFLSPLWARCPRIVFLHHVHAEMWKMVLPKGLAELGYAFEHRGAPPVYRRSRIVTLSSSSKAEIVERLGLPGSNITVVPPGVEPHFSPAASRSEVPLVVAVGRLVPVKRLDLLIEALVQLKPRHPDLRAVIAGEGYERPMLEALVRAHGAEEWIELPGHIDQEALIDLYRRAWVVASSSLREGWGMTVTEAGACGTPSVVSRISGHEDAVVDGESGLLFDDADGMVEGLDAVLVDEVLRKRLGMGALDYSARFTWDATARQTLAVLGAERLRRLRRFGSPGR